VLEDDLLGLVDEAHALDGDARGTEQHGVGRGRDEVVLAEFHPGVGERGRDVRPVGRQRHLATIDEDGHRGGEHDVDRVAVRDGSLPLGLDPDVSAEQIAHTGVPQRLPDGGEWRGDAPRDRAVDGDVDRDRPLDDDLRAVGDRCPGTGRDHVGRPDPEVQPLECLGDRGDHRDQIVAAPVVEHRDVDRPLDRHRRPVGDRRVEGRVDHVGVTDLHLEAGEHIGDGRTVDPDLTGLAVDGDGHAEGGRGRSQWECGDRRDGEERHGEHGEVSPRP
jgi:hypothetical protein